jgi:lysophospholipase L1-like esterase
MSEESTRSNTITDVATDRGLRRVSVGILAILPIGLIVDVLRPALFERHLFEQVALMRGEAEPALTKSDVMVVFLCALLLVGGRWLLRSMPTRAIATMAVAAWASVFALAGAEVVLRLGGPIVYQPGLRVRFHPRPDHIPGVAGPSRFTTNRLGMRGPEWPDSGYRILAVGGSTTICLYLDDSKAWPERLMNILNERQADRRYWVGNVGKSGLDSLHHVELLKRLREVKKVDCVLILCGVNDLSHALRLPAETRQRLAPSSVFERGGGFNPMLPYLKQTYLYRTAKAFVRSGASQPAERVEDDTGSAYAARRRIRHTSTKDHPLPPLDEHLSLYARNLEQMISVCREQRIRCVLMTQPTTWQDPMPPRLEALTWFAPMASTKRAISSPDLSRAMAAFNQTMLDVCRRHSVQCIDLAAIVPKTEEMFYDEEHFTDAGAELVAQAIAGGLLEK